MFVKRIVFVVVLSFILLVLVGNIFDSRYRNRWNTLFFTSSDTLIKGQTDYDIIFTGNSRIHFGINPYFIDSVTGRSSYNFGIGGADMETLQLIASLYLQNHAAPDFLVIGLDDGLLVKSDRLKTLYHFLFYMDNDLAFTAMKKNGFPAGLIRYFPFLKFSFFQEYDRNSLFLKGKPYPKFDHNIYNGFINVHQGFNQPEKALYNVADYDNQLWDSAGKYADQIISSFKAAGTRVVFLYPPLRKSDYRETIVSKKADSIFTNLANKYRLPIWDLRKDSRYADKYFTDKMHLNNIGATLLSIQTGDSLSHYLNTNLSPVE